MALTPGQLTQLNVGAAVALRTSFLIEALLRLADDTPAAPEKLSAVRQKLAAYRTVVDELTARFHLSGDLHDVRPIAIDQAFRLRDALGLSLVDELHNFGTLDPDDERFLRHHLATLSLMVDEIARAIYQLPPRLC